MTRTFAVGVTGASGAIYAVRTIGALLEEGCHLEIVFSEYGRRLMMDELGPDAKVDKLIDIRVRAAKAADLQARLGVSVEWQRYSWIELEALRRTLLSFEQYRNSETPTDTAPATAQPSEPPPSVSASASTNGLVRPTFKVRAAGRAGRSSDPDAIIRPRFTGRTEAPTETRAALEQFLLET